MKARLFVGNKNFDWGLMFAGLLHWKIKLMYVLTPLGWRVIHFVIWTADNLLSIVLLNIKRNHSLFPLNDKIKHLAYVIYKGIYLWVMNYIGETVQNVQTRWSKHNKMSSKSKLANHVIGTLFAGKFLVAF